VKLGCSSWSYHAAFRGGRIDLPEFLRVCGEELELDGVELVDLHFAATEPDALREIKRRMVELHLTLAGLAVSNDFGARERRDAERLKVQQWCDVAAYMGAPIVRVFAGWIPPAEPPRDDGRIVGLVRRLIGPQRPDPRRTWSDIAETLRMCADYAGERGVTIALQNTRSDGIVGSPVQLAQLVRDVGSPWLKVCLDPADLADRTGLDLALPATVQAHARMRDVAEDGSDTRITWPLLVQTLQLGRYRGFLLLDYEGIEDPETAVPRAARYLRGVLHLLARQRVLSEAASTEQVPDDLAADNATETADDVVIRTSAPTRSDALSRGAAR
jgi:sugar phosphate isomerase/epimerase